MFDRLLITVMAVLGMTSAALAAAPSEPESRVRVSVAVDDAHGHYRVDTTGASGLLAHADYGTKVPGFAGIAADVQWLPAVTTMGSGGVDFRGNAHVETYALADGGDWIPQRDTNIGALWRVAVSGGASAQVSAGYHMISGTLFRVDGLGDVNAEAYDVNAGRLGVGLVLEGDGAFMQVELAESFAPGPCDTHAGVRVDVPVSEHWAVRFGATADVRAMPYEAPDDGPATLTQQVASAQVGMSWSR